jgi:hypothetical protein
MRRPAPRKGHPKFRVLVASLLALGSPGLPAAYAGTQDADPTASTDVLRFYIECRSIYCGPDRNVPDVSFAVPVESAGLADVRITIETNLTAADRVTHTLLLSGRKSLAGIERTRSTVSLPRDSTADHVDALRTEIRAALIEYRVLQLVTEQESSPAELRAKTRLRVFLDCQTGGCNFDRFRTDITFVDWVRDREDSDVHLLITSEETGAQGDRFQLDFIGREKFESQGLVLIYDALSFYTDEEELKGLTRRIAQGLAAYAASTESADWITVEYSPPDLAPPALRSDPWDHWVFSLAGSGDYFAQASTTGLEASGSLSINRTTEAFKIDAEFYGGYVRDEFQYEGETFSSTAHQYGVTGLAAWSLGPHWTIGFRPEVWSSTFSNIELGARFAPAIEYNIFPYWEVSRRQFTIEYSIGVDHFRYFEITLFDRLSETLPSHRAVASLDLSQQWGGTGLTLGGSQFLNDPSKFRVVMAGELNLRITRGLSLDLRGAYEAIRDQINLPKEDATEEEVLLRRRELATDYEFRFSIGLRYRFGSIFNNVVNTRLNNKL